MIILNLSHSLANLIGSIFKTLGGNVISLEVSFGLLHFGLHLLNDVLQKLVQIGILVQQSLLVCVAVRIVDKPTGKHEFLKTKPSQFFSHLLVCLFKSSFLSLS